MGIQNSEFRITEVAKWITNYLTRMNHQNSVDHQIFFLTKFCLLFFSTPQKPVLTEIFFCWLIKKKLIFSAKSKHEKNGSWYFAKKIFGDPRNFVGSDATNWLKVLTILIDNHHTNNSFMILNPFDGFFQFLSLKK